MHIDQTVLGWTCTCIHVEMNLSIIQAKIMISKNSSEYLRIFNKVGFIDSQHQITLSVVI